MYPHERSLVKHLAGKPFALIGVNSQDKISKVKKLVADGVVTWRSFKNETGEGNISDSWEVNGWPTVYLLDAEGKIRFKNPQRSAKGLDALDDAIAELLEEMGEEFPADAIKATAKAEAKKKPGKQAKPADDGELSAPGE